MLISCVICSDLLVASDEVSVTPCGHLFHVVCVHQWLERSKSCPQCRSKATDKTIHRIYFNVSNQDGIEDTSSLQNRLDSLTFDIRLKNKDLKNAQEKIELLQRQVIGLKSEVKSLEDKISSQLSTISAFKHQIKFLQEGSRDGDVAKLECKRLRNQLQTLKSIDTVVKGTSVEVEELVQNYQISADSLKSLGTFIVILKKELKASTDKRKNLRDLLRETEIDIKKIITERDKLRNEVKCSNTISKQLEEDVKHLETSKKSLQKQVEALEKAIISPSAEHPRDRAIRRLIAESPAPEEVKRPRLTDPAELDESEPQRNSQPIVVKTNVEPPVTPYLKIKSSNIGLTPLRTSQNSNNFHLPKNNHSIFKNSRALLPLKSSSVASFSKIEYDGLGGHSKPDDFPKPTSSGKSFKKSKSASTIFKTKNLLAPKNILKLENYFDQA